MKKLITVVVLATAALSAPAFAKSYPTSSGQRNAPAYQQNDSLDWVRDHAKGYIG